MRLNRFHLLISCTILKGKFCFKLSLLHLNFFFWGSFSIHAKEQPRMVPSLLSSVDAPLGHRFDHKNFTFCTCMHKCPWNIFGQYSLQILIEAIFPLIRQYRPGWLIIELSYLVQMCICIGYKHTKRTRSRDMAYIL